MCSLNVYFTGDKATVQGIKRACLWQESQHLFAESVLDLSPLALLYAVFTQLIPCMTGGNWLTVTAEAFSSLSFAWTIHTCFLDCKHSPHTWGFQRMGAIAVSVLVMCGGGFGGHTLDSTLQSLSFIPEQLLTPLTCDCALSPLWSSSST